ncbi:MAG TPA: HAD family hydrolase [Candidatus Saccharimonadales bacterium]|jgi:D-glycero-D-manno-heptose 1,7-bisphosphate phosphatase
MKAVFLDRDGTINAGIPVYERVDSIEKLKLLPNVIDALKRLSQLDYAVFFITNQAGISEGLITMDQFDSINTELLKMIAPSGVKVLKTYVCPHGEDASCECRKPKPKLILDAASEYDIDLAQSWIIGDRPSDVMTGVNAGTKTILVKSGDPNVESSEATFTAPSLLEAIEYIAKN